MKKSIILTILLILLAVGVSRAAGYPPVTVMVGAGRHPAAAIRVKLAQNISFDADHGRGRMNAGMKVGFVGLYMNGRHSKVSTLFSVEGRVGSEPLARLHLSQHGYKVRKTELEWGAFAGSDFGIWGKAMVNKKVEICAGKYDNIASRAGVYYMLRETDRLGVAYSALLGGYVSYSHTFGWGK